MRRSLEGKQMVLQGKRATNRWVDKQTNRQTDKQTSRRADEQTANGRGDWWWLLALSRSVQG